MDAAAEAPCIPIVNGSIALWLGKKCAAGSTEHTHRWMVFLRHAEDKDLSYAVAKVAFTLHPSFTNHIRGERPAADGSAAARASCVTGSARPPPTHPRAQS